MTKESDQDTKKNSAYARQPTQQGKLNAIKEAVSLTLTLEDEKRKQFSKKVWQKFSAEDQTTDNTTLCHLLPIIVSLWLNLYPLSGMAVSARFLYP